MNSTNDLVGQTINLAHLLTYQAGAVVSRTILDHQTGTVTLFAFDTGQGLSEHTAPFDALVYILEGEAEITVTGQAYLVKTGEMLIMPAGQPHALQALRKFKMLLIMLRS